MSTQDHAGDHDTVGPKARKRLWMVFWLLLGITIAEIAIAFSPLAQHKDLIRSIFIFLTLVKAYYIVFYFMHLKHEQVGLKFALIGPFVILIGYFVFMMMTEGNKINWIHQIFDKSI
jgi:cytochrome c oxidase subunit 4